MRRADLTGESITVLFLLGLIVGLVILTIRRPR